MCAVRLSFCIPTLNFAEFLPATLDSILGQANESIEVVIVDGGSTDATDQIVRDYQQRYERIVYFRREERMGVDADILKSVELASGEYCWLFSSDDVLRDGAIERVLQLIDDRWNVLLTNFSLCDERMQPTRTHRILAGVDEPTVFDLDVPAERTDYLTRAETSTAFFSFISAVVVRRRDWLGADVDPGMIGTHWIICAKGCSMIKSGCRVCYHPQPLLNKREDNDSFLARGISWRTRLGIEGFPAIAEQAFGAGSPEHRAFLRVVRNEHPLSVMASRTLLAGEREGDAGVAEMRRLADAMWRDTGPSGRIKRAVLRATPMWGLRLLRAVFGR